MRESLAFELSTTQEVTNPFGYARQFVQVSDGSRFATFFYPHDVSPSVQAGGWYQGENARIASPAAAARMAAAYFPGDAFAADLQSYADDQLNWICGLNPYASSMLNGSGLNSPAYYDWAEDWRRTEQWLPHSTWFLYAAALGGASA